jgi:hypothetical protein
MAPLPCSLVIDIKKPAASNQIQQHMSSNKGDRGRNGSVWSIGYSIKDFSNMTLAIAKTTKMK